MPIEHTATRNRAREAQALADQRLDMFVDDLHRAAALTDPMERTRVALRVVDHIRRMGWRDSTSLAIAAVFRVAELTFPNHKTDH